MRRVIYICLASLALSVGMTSCKKDYFDKDTATQITKITFHNDTVDAGHTWSLMKEDLIRVTANVPGVQRVNLLTANPYVSDKAELLNSASVTEGEQVLLMYSSPVINDSIYADAVTRSGNHVVKAVAVGTQSTDFSTLNTANSGTVNEINAQEVYYCYCNSFPKPSSTWDFNDCVMRISKEVIDDYTLRLNVTVEAMGTLTKTAAAIRLPGVAFGDVESVTTVGNRTFVKNKDVQRTYITEEDLLLKGRDGSAVINLFDDGHMAFYSRVDQTGALFRYYYNVSRTVNTTYAQFPAPTVSYDIKFKEKDMASRQTFTSLDPFIVCAYSSVLVEVHKYRFKLDEVLFEFLGNPADYRNNYTWAVEVPYSWFRYPLEGNSLGSLKGKGVFGTYSTIGHSFGEWGADRTQSQDWYLYPTSSMVY